VTPESRQLDLLAVRATKHADQAVREQAVDTLVASHAALARQLAAERESHRATLDRLTSLVVTERLDLGEQLLVRESEATQLLGQLASAESVMQDQCYAIEAYKSERVAVPELEREIETLCAQLAQVRASLAETIDELRDERAARLASETREATFRFALEKYAHRLNKDERSRGAVWGQGR